ncbi:polyketide antibiotic transporter [Tessaracoccus rhinocerotis]|uniref:Polyketide antibiotic transporter n=1 Tax=Tessaracoccus rhinocerotis TaxID=1689449 RepID=A0A553K4V9_9ACTN|nr:polyketide antibiotic transporter [Tessaracoccus rhinocerotis]TRY19739.1 polyketide antibiotic transporter [Tessaracoccus rhinocerotis]
MSGSPFTGTAALTRLNLRLDRLRLVIWAVAILLCVWGSVIALDEAFPTQESLDARGALLGNPATIMMTGPAFQMEHYTFGAMLANELGLYLFIAVAIMAILLAVRHTRAEEESGRLELIRSLPVGRFAPATASIITVAVASVLAGAATTLGLLLPGLEAVPVVDAVAFGVAAAATGMVFAGLATLFAQLTENTRGVTGMSMAALAIAFLVRGVGDVINHSGSWLSWLSPFAWAQQTRMFVDLRWWPLLVSLAVTVALFAVAVAFARRRDIGAGLRPTRPGPATAPDRLGSPVGLAARLLRGGVIAWGIGAFFFAVAMGSLSGELDDMLASNPQLEDWIALEGTDLTGEFATIILSYVLVAPLVTSVSGVLRLKSEEEDGRAEQLLVAGNTRTGYLLGWLATVGIQTVLLTVLSGLGVGLGVWAGTGESDRVGEMLLAAVVFLPAILLVAAFAVACYGAAPRATGLAWLLVVWVVLVLFLGELLRLPDWVRNVSPFTHTPLLPGADLEAAPLLVVGGIALALLAIGALGFRRRDIASR